MHAFIANPRTAAPLTFALEGAWGSGKSSAMRLIQSDLEKDNFPTVWFNAWHHQKEEHLFASLMEEIRANALPGPTSTAFFKRVNIALRLKILARRLVKQPFRYALFAAVLTFLGIMAFTIAPDLAVKGTGGLLVSVFGVLGAGLYALRMMRELAAPFKDSPAVLIDPSRQMFGAARFQGKLSFRDQFASAFREVTEALGDRRLVIFIDDLDRCSRDQIVETLEAVNFLTSNGDCHIILGIHQAPVVHAIGLAFEDQAIAEAEAAARRIAGTDDRPDTQADAEHVESPQERHIARVRYARRYIEKLVNISVKTPPFDGRALEKIIGDGREGVIATALKEQAEKDVKRRTIAGVIVAAAVIISGWVAFGTGLIATIESALIATATGDDVPETASPTDTATAIVDATSSTNEAAAAFDLPIWSFAPVMVFAVIALAALAFVHPRSREWLNKVSGHRRAVDHKAFETAIRAYLPLLMAADGKSHPRAVKRLINYVHFLTARMDDAGEIDAVVYFGVISKAARLHVSETAPSAEAIGMVHADLLQRVAPGLIRHAAPNPPANARDYWQVFRRRTASASFHAGDGEPKV